MHNQDYYKIENKSYDSNLIKGRPWNMPNPIGIIYLNHSPYDDSHRVRTIKTIFI